MTRRSSSRLAGFMYLFYIATGVGGMVLFARTTGGEGTAAKLAVLVQHETLVRFGASYSLLMMMNAVVLGVALYSLTREYDPDLALLALICRVIEGINAMLGSVWRRALLAVATSAQTATGPDATATNALGAALLKVQGLPALLGATAFAIGSTIFCWLFLRARTIPNWLAWLGVVGSLLLVVGLPLQIGGVLTGPPTYLIWIPVAIFEVVFAVWLLVKGVAPQEGAY